MLTNFTTNTSTGGYPSKGSSLNVIAFGTWGGATLSLEVYDISSDDWVAVYSATSDDKKNVLVGSGAEYRLTVSGGVAHDIDVYVIDVKTRDLSI